MEHIERLKEEIALQFEYCNPADTPFLCGQLATKEGYDKMMNLIIDLVGGDALSISQAMLQVERTYNINSID